jgi:hypothetical protein
VSERELEPRKRSIEELILEVRGQKVLLDADLARLYGVPTKALNQAVSRNAERFPRDFAFRLIRTEWKALKSQIVTSKIGSRGGPRALPRVFTEEGVAMLSGVLRSPEAVAVNVAIMRAFVQVRRVLRGHDELLRRVDELETRVGAHDAHLRAVFQAIRKLIEGPPVPARRRIGFDEADD